MSRQHRRAAEREAAKREGIDPARLARADVQAASIDAATPLIRAALEREVLGGVELGDLVAVVADRLEPALAQTFWTEDEWRAWGEEISTPGGRRIVVGVHKREAIRADFQSRGGGLRDIANKQLLTRPASGEMWIVLFIAGELGVVPMPTNLSCVLRSQGQA